MKKILILCIILLGMIFISACGDKEDGDDHQKPLEIEISSDTEDLSYEQLQKMNGESLEVGVNPKTGKIREIQGKFSTVIVRKPEDALLALMSVRNILSISGHEFTCMQVDEQEENRTYWLQQLYKGVPVDEGVFRIVVSSKGETKFVRGVYQQDLNLDVKPAMDADAAFQKYGKEESIKETSLVIYSTPSIEPILAWKYLANVGTVQEKFLYLDANTGELLEDRAMIIE